MTSFSAAFVSNFFNPEKKGSIQTEHLGCFYDKSDRAMPILEGVDPTLDGHYSNRKNVFLKCARAAYRRRFKVFGLQNGGQCFSGPEAHETYAKYGSSSSCHDGLGVSWRNEVYRIKGK